jgi:pimeloyl-ACP methyl ester carboxylesterase
VWKRVPPTINKCPKRLIRRRSQPFPFPSQSPRCKESWIRSDPKRVPELFNDLPAEDEAVLARPDVREVLAATMTEAFHQGTRGAVHDIGLEARPWNVELAAIETPVDVWHGHKDTLVSVTQGEALARAIPSASSRLLPEEGHVSLRVDRIAEILEPFA